MSSLQKNGLTNRFRELKVTRIMGGITASYLILCFLAPAALPTDSVPELSGRANAIDYAFADSWGNKDHGENAEVGHDQSMHGGSFSWMELNPVFAFTYGFGDLNCHQKYYRSWEINGNQLPVCVRDIGIFLGFTIGCLLFGVRGYNRWTVRDTFLSVIPDKYTGPLYHSDKRLIAVFAILGIGLFPMGVDGFTQLLTSYESNNAMRLLTGSIAGCGGGWGFCAAFSARPNLFEGPGEVALPAGSKLVTK